MDKKPRLGTDPLSWIGDSGGSKQGKQGLPSKQELQGRLLRKSRAGRKRTNLREVSKTSQLGTAEGWTRATIIMREDYLEKLKALAYWERKSIKDLMDEVYSAYLKGKTVKPMPKGAR